MSKGKGSALAGGGQTLGADETTETDFRPFSDGTTDVTYHTPAWHKARIEALMAPRVSYEEWNLKKKEAEGKLAAVAESEERNMLQYRAMLDADRAARLAGGSNRPKVEEPKKKKKEKEKDKKSKKRKREKKEKEKHKKKHKKRDHSSSGDSSDSSSDDDSSDSNSDEDRRRAKRKKKKSKASKQVAAPRGKDEPVRLSDYLRS